MRIKLLIAGVSLPTSFKRFPYNLITRNNSYLCNYDTVNAMNMKTIYEIPSLEEIEVRVEANILSGEAGGEVPDIPGCDDNED